MLGELELTLITEMVPHKAPQRTTETILTLAASYDRRSSRGMREDEIKLTLWMGWPSEPTGGPSSTHELASEGGADGGGDNEGRFDGDVRGGCHLLLMRSVIGTSCLSSGTVVEIDPCWASPGGMSSRVRRGRTPASEIA